MIGNFLGNISSFSFPIAGSSFLYPDADDVSLFFIASGFLPTIFVGDLFSIIVDGSSLLLFIANIVSFSAVSSYFLGKRVKNA